MADKIDQLNIGGTAYDIDLPPDNLTRQNTVYNAFSLSNKSGSATAGSELSVRWYATGVDGDSTITAPYEGMKILVKVPRVGVSTAGVVLSLNGNTAAEYHPVLYNASTVLTSHYPVNTYKMLIYRASATATGYLTAGTSSTITGVWYGESDYDSNTDTKVRQYQAGTDAMATGYYPILARYAVTDKAGSYDANYARFYTGTTIDTSTGAIYESGTALSSKYAGINHTHSEYLTTAVTKLGTRTGDITINNLKSDLGLGSAAYLTAGTAASNVLQLDSSGKVPDTALPALAITDTYEAANEAAMLALDAQKGDVCIRTDLNKSFILSAAGASTLSNWKELKTPTDTVLSVNGQTGAVTLTLDNISDGTSRKLSDYLPLSGGTLTDTLTTKDITLYSASGDSPRLTFQRGTLTDTYNDWSIYDTAGLLHIQQRGSGSTAWETRAKFTQSGAEFTGAVTAGSIVVSSSAAAITIKNTSNAYSDTPSTAASRYLYFKDKNDANIADIHATVGSSWNALNLVLVNKSNVTRAVEFCYDGARWRFNPNDNNQDVDLGKSDRPWNNIYGVNVYASSDLRLKENIIPVQLNCSDIISRLPLKEFNFISDPEKKVVVGAIAQELAAILPEKYRATLVNGSEDTSYSINEGKLLYVAIGALKDAQRKINELEERVHTLEEEMGV